jgi:hypothetical protein
MRKATVNPHAAQGPHSSPAHVPAVARAVCLCVPVPLAEAALLQGAVAGLVAPQLALPTAWLPALDALGRVVVDPTCAAGSPVRPTRQQHTDGELVDGWCR